MSLGTHIFKSEKPKQTFSKLLGQFVIPDFSHESATSLALKSSYFLP